MKICFAFLCLLLMSCSKLSLEHVNSHLGTLDTSAIHFGTRVEGYGTDSNYQFREFIVIRDGRNICSGTVVGPNVILTSAHSPCGAANGSRRVELGIDYTNLTRATNKVEFVLHPDYNDAVMWGAGRNDIAVGIVSGRQFESFTNICPPPADPASLMQKQILFFGHGSREYRPTGSSPANSGLTYAENFVSDVRENFLEITSLMLPYPYNSQTFSAPGDSGGPYMLVTESNTMCQISVNYTSDRVSKSISSGLFDTKTRQWLATVASNYNVQICGINVACPVHKIPQSILLKKQN